MIFAYLVSAAAIFALGWFLCSRAQANRLAAAHTVLQCADTVRAIMAEATRVASQYQSHLSERDEKEAGLSESVALTANSLDGVLQANKNLAEQVNRMDATLGKCFNALVATGVIQTVAAGRATRERMVGESEDIPIGTSAAHV